MEEKYFLVSFRRENFREMLWGNPAEELRIIDGIRVDYADSLGCYHVYVTGKRAEKDFFIRLRELQGRILSST